MANYEQYGILDFLADERFRSWVLAPTPELTYFWNSWLERYPEKSGEVMKAKAFLLRIEYPKELAAKGRKDAIFEKIVSQTRVNKKNLTKAKQAGGAISPSSWYNHASVAAVWAGVLLAVGLLGWWLQDPTPSPQASLHADTQQVYLERSTNFGEKLTLKLPDGSIVKLNAGSTIRFPEHFAPDYREVYIEGEAFFDVQRDTMKPFKVYAGGVCTQVLGTSFNVNHQPHTNNVQVAVLTGRVQVVADGISGGATVVLNPAEMVYCSSGAMMQGQFEPRSLLAWKDGVLLFDMDDLPEIAKKLEHWYGYKVLVDPNLKLQRRFSARFENAPLSQVLQGLAYTSNIQYEIKDKTVNITRK